MWRLIEWVKSRPPPCPVQGHDVSTSGTRGWGGRTIKKWGRGPKQTPGIYCAKIAKIEATSVPGPFRTPKTEIPHPPRFAHGVCALLHASQGISYQTCLIYEPLSTFSDTERLCGSIYSCVKVLQHQLCFSGRQKGSKGATLRRAKYELQNCTQHQARQTEQQHRTYRPNRVLKRFTIPLLTLVYSG